MQLYKHILVTIDCSSVDLRVIDHISKLAQQNQSSVSILHVVHAHTMDQDRALRETAEKMLQSYAETLTHLGIETEILIRRGEPDEEILSEVHGNDYDLVVMAPHGHSLISSFVFGSVTRTLKSKLTVPLLLITQDSD